MVRENGPRLDIKSASRGHYDVELNGAPISNMIDRVTLDLSAKGDSRALLHIPAPVVTLTVNDLPAVHVYRAQIVSTLGVEPDVDGLTAEGLSMVEALEKLIGRVKEVHEAANAEGA